MEPIFHIDQYSDYAQFRVELDGAPTRHLYAPGPSHAKKIYLGLYGLYSERRGIGWIKGRKIKLSDLKVTRL